MLKEPLVCLDISDVHLGHDNTPTQDIIQRIKPLLLTEFKEAKPHYLFISGDFFDQLLNLPSHPSGHIQAFITWLLKQCRQNNTKLRVLEGTPSHDWKQNQLFLQINQNAEIQADVQYYDKPTVVEEEITILYIPDEWDEDNKVTEQHVLNLLKEKGLQFVDLVIMHGMFHFQVPSHLHKSLPLHDQSVYESFTNYLIIIGHDHKHKRNNKVIVPGSTDRLVHGDEDPKGFIKFILKPNGKSTVTFIENKEAETYKSITLLNNDVEDAFKTIDDVVNTLPLNAKVRLVLDHSHPILTHLQELGRKYPTVIWTKPKVTRPEETTELKQVLQQSYTAIVLNQDNLQEKLINQIQTKQYDIDLNQATQLLTEVQACLK